MNDEEFRDPELAARLRRLAGPTPDALPAYGRVERRVTQARRRRAAVWSAAGTSALILGVVALRPQQTADQISMTSSPNNGPAVSLSGEPPTSATIDPNVAATSLPSSSSTMDTVVDESTTVAVIPTPAPTLPVVPPATALPKPTASVPATTRQRPAPSSSAPSTSAPSSSSSTSIAPPTNPTSPPTNPPAVDITKQCVSTGGAITVRLNGGVLSLVASSANDEFDKDVNESGPNEVQVNFESDEHRSRITASISGQDIVCRAEEDGETARSTAPPDSSDSHSSDESEWNAPPDTDGD